MKMKAIDKNAVPPEKPIFDDKELHLRRQSLLAHLRDLRKTLMISVLAILVGFLVVFFGFSEPLIAYLTESLTSKGIDIIYTSLTETFSVQIKASFVAGFVLAAPIVLWQVWAFVVPALYKKERATFTCLYIVAIILFAVGVMFAYGIVFNMAVNFFIVTGENLATPMISIDTFVDFLFSFILPFGIVFELPIAIIVLINAELITVDTLVKYRKYVIFVIFVLAAILTPPDVVSQLMLGIPLTLLYEVGILIAKVMSFRKKKKE